MSTTVYFDTRTIVNPQYTKIALAVAFSGLTDSVYTYIYPVECG